MGISYEDNRLDHYVGMVSLLVKNPLVLRFMFAPNPILYSFGRSQLLKLLLSIEENEPLDY